MATPSILAGFKLVPDDGGSSRPPEARGKAAALSAYLARGGTPFKMSGRYKKGPMKGKTVDEATAAFERMWASAPDSIKEKYASRSQKTDLAPSERAPIDRPSTNASLNASLPGETPTQREARQRASRTANDPKQTPAPVAAPGEKGSTLAGPPRSAMPKPAADPVNVGTPEERARVAAMVNEGSDFATADNGDQAMKAAVVQSLAGKTPEEQRAMLTADATANPPTAAQKVTQSPMPPADPPISSPAKVAGKPFAGAKPPDINGQIADVAATVGKGLVAAAGNAARPPDYNSTLKPSPAAPVAAPSMPAQGAPITPGMSTDERMHAKGKTNVGGVPVVKAPATVQPPVQSPSAAPTSNLQTDERMHAEGKVNGGPAPVNKAPVDQAARTLSSGGPVARPASPRIGATPAGQELIGMGPGGVPKYAPIAEVYGSTQQTDQQQRTAYQAREGPRAAGMVAPAARPAAPIAGPRPMPRGPASQPERTGSAVAPIAPPRANDPDIIRKDNEARAKYQASFGNDSTDQEFDNSKHAQNKLYQGASSQDQAKLVANSLKNSNKVEQDLRGQVASAPRASVPGNTRVVARRPATPEELRTGKVATPPVRRPMLAR